MIQFVKKIAQNIGNKIFGDKMNEEEKDFKINLLTDEAVDIDSIGSHEKVADSICKIIGSTVGGKSIALRGKWEIFNNQNDNSKIR